MQANHLLTGQYFTGSGCAEGNAYLALPRDKYRPDKVLGQLVFIYSPTNLFHSTQVRVFDSDEEVSIIDPKKGISRKTNNERRPRWYPKYFNG